MAIKGSSVIPSVRYRDAQAAIEWLVRVLGFEKQAVFEGPNGTVMHAQLTRGMGMVMLGSIPEKENPPEAGSPGSEYHGLLAQPEEVGGRETASLCLVVEDCEGLYATVKDSGAEMVQELKSPEYGGKAFACRDPEGHVWWVGSYDPWAEPDGGSA